MAANGETMENGLCALADLDGTRLVCDQSQGPPVEIDLDTGVVTPIAGLDDGVVTLRRPTP